MAKKIFSQIMIEPTSVCNLKCVGCPNGAGFFSQHQGTMTFRQFKKIIDLNEGHLDLINLWGFGEPFLAPDIMKMVNYAGKNGIYVSIHTNANAFNKKTLGRFKDCQARVSLTFSIDGLTQKTYGFYRQGGSFKKAMSALRFLTDLKKTHNLSNLKIIWQFLIMETNKREIPAVYQLADKLGVDELKLKTISIHPENPRYGELSPKNYQKYLREGKEERRQMTEEGKCEYIKNGSVLIFWDGATVPCCYDYKREYLIGNAFKESLATLWNKSAYKNFRKSHRSKKNQLCQRCKFSKGKVKTYVQ